MRYVTTLAALALSALALSTLTTLMGAAALAGGFQVSETSVVGLGRAFAGAGVTGDGPSDVFHNPAGLMLRRGRELEIGLHAIRPSAKFTDNGSTLPDTTQPASGPNADGGANALVPNFFYAADLGAKARYGLGITSPFGLTTNYHAQWIGRYHAIKSELITLEVNPAVAFKAGEAVSIGGGITVLEANTELSQAINLVGADARVTVEGDDTALGFNLGILIGNEDARIGFGYRSSVDLEVEGERTIVGPRFASKIGARAAITLPATAYLSGFKTITDKLDLLATLRWTDWSEFDELRIEFEDGTNSTTPQNWQDSNTYSIGLNYRHNDRWRFRAGYAKDESPIRNRTFRTARIPDAHRDWFALGASYHPTTTTQVDFSFARLFTDQAAVANAAGLKGAYEAATINLFALGARWLID